LRKSESGVLRTGSCAAVYRTVEPAVASSEVGGRMADIHEKEP